MKKTALVVLSIAALALAGCKDKPKTETLPDQQAAGALPAGHPAVGGMPSTQGGKPAMPNGTDAKGVNPHAGMTLTTIPQGVPTKSGKVLQVLDGGQYIYMEVQLDDGKKVWVSALPMKVAKGDKVKYADSPAIPMHSKVLNRDFEALVLIQAVEIVK